MSDAVVARLRDVAKTYHEKDAPPVDVLHGVDLDVAERQILSIVGPSGSGKSTLLNILGLLDRPSSGTISIDGAPMEEAGDAERTRTRSGTVGFVFQQFHLIGRRTVLDNVCLGGLYAGMARAERIARARDVVDRVGLTRRIAAPARNLSGGERQRVAVARALVARPRLLLCDEPTGNLDERTSDGICRLLAEIAADGPAVVVVTHDPAVAALGRRVVRVADGTVHGDTLDGETVVA